MLIVCLRKQSPGVRHMDTLTPETKVTLDTYREEYFQEAMQDDWTAIRAVVERYNLGWEESFGDTFPEWRVR